MPSETGWRVGPGFIEVRDLVFVGVDLVSTASIQPIFALARHRRDIQPQLAREATDGDGVFAGVVNRNLYWQNNPNPIPSGKLGLSGDAYERNGCESEDALMTDR